MSIIFAPEAEADLRELLDYVADRNPRAAEELEERIFDIIERLAVREMEGPEQRLRTRPNRKELARATCPHLLPVDS